MPTSPAPYDLALNGIGYMLAPDQTNNPQYNQSRMQFSRNTVTPAAQPYAVADPKLEAPRGFFMFDHGMGFQFENVRADQDVLGYKYGINIDSGEGYICNGPAVTSFSPSNLGTTTGHTKFFEFTVGGTRKLCVLAGQYVLVRDNDTTWTLARDLGNGVVANRVAVFRGQQGQDYAFIACGTTANYWVWDGTNDTTNFTQLTDYSIAFWPTRDYLMRITINTSGGGNNGYILQRCYDGGSSPTWSGPFYVSDLSNVVNDMAMHDDKLYIFTTRGMIAPMVESLQDWSFKIQDLTPAFSTQYDVSFGAGAAPWWQYLFVPNKSTLFKYDSQGNFDEMGLATLQNNTSEVQGAPTAIAGYKNQTMFGAFYNAINGNSYLMRWGTFRFMELQPHYYGDPGARRVFVPGWHGALYKLSNAQINAMFYTEVSGGPRLYMLDSNGLIYYLTLPRYSMDWTSDTACRFSTSGTVYLPGIHHGVIHETKANLGIAVLSENLSSGSITVTAAVRTTPSGSFDSSGLQSGGVFTSSPGQRLDLSSPSNGKVTEIKCTMTGTSTVPSIMRGIALYQNVRPVFKWVYKIGLRVSDHVIDGYGNPHATEYSSSDLIQALQDCATFAYPVTLIDPAGNSVSVLVTDLQVALLHGDTMSATSEWVAQIEAIQSLSSVNTNVGSYGELDLLTYSYLQNFTYGQIGVIG